VLSRRIITGVVALAVLSVLTALLSGPSSAQDSAPGSSSKRTSPLAYRYVFDSGAQPAAVVAHGWNLIDVDSRARADALPRGARALLWVGDYDNTSCGWQVSDAALEREIATTRGDPKIAGYFYSDEPDPFACPDAPAQHRARSALIHKLDPAKFTVMVMDSNSGQTSLRQVRLWKGAADFVGLNPYICYRDKPCDFGWINTIIHAADRVGFRYWGAVQAFADKDWRWPTPAEEQRMLALWSASNASGYMTFAWTWDGNALSTQSGLLGVFGRFNSATIPPKKKRVTSSVDGPRTADEIHYTFTGANSVAFDWRGTATAIRYGLTARYGRKAVAHPARPMPFSSPGPFYEVQLTGLRPGTTYHYSIGGGKDHTFSTSPVGAFRFDVEADVGDTKSSDRVAPTQRQIAADRPAFVLVPGDLTYGNDEGQHAVDQHFNDVMAWSPNAAYMPAWGNHEWDSSRDDLRNYKGRFAIPHPQASAGAPSEGCCGEDWGWFDAGPVRFVSYPEPYSDSTWQDWEEKAAPIMAAAQANPKISFIVTFGHRPAYSTGYHSGASDLAADIGSLASRYSKYVLNLNGHSHDYERFKPIDGVVHVTTGGGGIALEPWGASADPRTAIRALHFQHLRIDVDTTQIRIQAVCGPPASDEDVSCRTGQVIDSYTIRARG
jgi:hypothetical protein